MEVEEEEGGGRQFFYEGSEEHKYEEESEEDCDCDCDDDDDDGCRVIVVENSTPSRNNHQIKTIRFQERDVLREKGPVRKMFERQINSSTIKMASKIKGENYNYKTCGNNGYLIML